MEYVGKTIYKNMSRKRDDSKSLTLEDCIPKEIVKETEKAIAIEDCATTGEYNSDLTQKLAAKLTWIPKGSIKEVEGEMLIPYWVYR